MLAALLLVGRHCRTRLFGAAHGEFLPQRVVLLGFIALVPIFDVDRSRWWGRALLASLIAAVALQSAIVWDYGLYSDRTAGQIIRAGAIVGRDQQDRHAARDIPSPVPRQPVASRRKLAGGRHRQRHLEQLRGTSLLLSGPVQARNRAAAPGRPGAGLDPRGSRRTRRTALRDWEQILSRYADSIDVILIWKSDDGARGDHQTLVRPQRTNRATCRSFAGFEARS